MSAAIAGLALSVGGAVMSANAASQNSKAQGRINSSNLELSRAQIAGENADRKSSNQIKAAQGGLARFMMTQNNKRLLDNAGKARAAAQQTLVRMQDSMASGDLESQISAAEAAGAFAANAAFNGTGGNAVDLIDMTMRLKQGRARAAQEQANGYATYDQVSQIAGIVPQAISGLDMGSVSDGLDLAENVAPAGLTTSKGPSVLGGALTGLLSSQFLKPAAQEIGNMFKGSGSDGMVGSGLKVGGQTEGFNLGSTFSFNDTGAGTSYRLF